MAIERFNKNELSKFMSELTIGQQTERKKTQTKKRRGQRKKKKPERKHEERKETHREKELKRKK